MGVGSPAVLDHAATLQGVDRRVDSSSLAGDPVANPAPREPWRCVDDVEDAGIEAQLASVQRALLAIPGEAEVTTRDPAAGPDVADVGRVGRGGHRKDLVDAGALL